MIEQTENMDLSSPTDWNREWTGARHQTATPLSIGRPGLHRDLHSFMKRHLTAAKGGACCELGCYPGGYLRYTAEYWGLRPFGVEYVKRCAQATRHNLDALGLDNDVCCNDFRTFEHEQTFDLVMSFGLIEHFTDTADVIHHHARLVKDGGQVLIVYPLHDGIYGRVMRRVAPDRLAQHNRMSLADGVKAAHEVPGVSIRAAELIGRFGFGSTRLHQYLDKLFPGSRALVGIPFRACELAGKAVLPNTRTLSTHAVLMLDVIDASRPCTD